MESQPSVQHFLNLIKTSRRGRFKIYIGMVAGVGKSYRMLQDAHTLFANGVDVQIAYIETHARPETEQL
ncbi:MAG: sensor protein KdpD, partial [Alistipes sp.]